MKDGSVLFVRSAKRARAFLYPVVEDHDLPALSFLQSSIQISVVLVHTIVYGNCFYFFFLLLSLYVWCISKVWCFCFFFIFVNKLSVYFLLFYWFLQLRAWYHINEKRVILVYITSSSSITIIFICCYCTLQNLLLSIKYDHWQTIITKKKYPSKHINKTNQPNKNTRFLQGLTVCAYILMVIQEESNSSKIKQCSKKNKKKENTLPITF